MIAGPAGTEIEEDVVANIEVGFGSSSHGPGRLRAAGRPADNDRVVVKIYGAAARCVATNRFNRLIVRKRRNDTDLIVVDGRGGETLDVNPWIICVDPDVLGRLLMRLRETETEVPLLR